MQVSEPRAVCIFVAYDHPDAGARAKALCERLGHSEDFDFDLRLESFVALQVASPSLFSPPEVLHTDILVVAWTQAITLPTGLIDWLSMWALRRKVADAALAALPLVTGGSSAVAAPGIHQLREVAAAHQLTFICDWTGGLGIPHDDFQSELRQREQTLTPTLAAILSDSHFDPHLDWGLND